MPTRAAGPPYPRPVTPWLQEPLLTERLRLRPWQECDFPQIVALKTDPEVRRYIGGPLSREKATVGTREQIAAQTWGHFVTASREDDKALGTLTFDRKRGPWEMSLQLRRDCWGQGLMSEAVARATGWFSEVAPDQDLIAVTQVDNARTQALLRRAGGVCENTFLEHGAEQSQYRFSLARPSGSCRYRPERGRCAGTMNWLFELLGLLSPVDWFRSPKRGAPRTVVHVDAAGSVVSTHHRGEPCEACPANGACG